MSTCSEPAANQWWLSSKGKVIFIAFDDRTIGSNSQIPFFGYDSPINGTFFRPSEFVRRLPDDAGFDYKPEPQYPEYWTPHNSRYAYIRRDSDTTHVCVELDGTESGPCNWSQTVHDGRTRLTKTEAEARVKKTDRWFIWSDNRYPIAFVKHANGKVQNLNVDLVLKQSDDWQQRYEEQLTNGELVEVTEFSAKAFLKRPRSASLIPKHEPPTPNRIPVRLWGIREYLHKQGMAVLCCPASVGPPTNEDWVEIKLDPQLNITASGFYVEGPVSP